MREVTKMFHLVYISLKKEEEEFCNQWVFHQKRMIGLSKQKIRKSEKKLHIITKDKLPKK